MDRNQIIGFSLIALLFTVYLYFFGANPASEGVTTVVDSTKIEIVSKAAVETPKVEAPVDSVVNQLMAQKYGIFASGGQGTEEEIVLENNNIQVTLSSKGGNVKKVLLKKYTTYDQKPLYLANENSSAISLMVATADNRSIDLSELYFTSTKGEVDGKQSVVFKLPVGEGQYVEQSFALPADGYQLDYNLNLVGLTGLVKNSDAVFTWKNTLQKIEYDINQSRDRSTVNYYTVEDGYDNLSEASRDEESEKIESKVKWVNMKQKFFNSAIIANNSFSNATVYSNVEGDDSTNIKVLGASLAMPMTDLLSGNGKYQYYFGPNEFKECKKVTEGFEENVNFGWPVIKWINRFVVLPVFQLLESFIGNYGIIIIILVILLKLVLLPLSYKSYISMAKMRVMKPELDEIKERVGGDMQKVQAEQMALYQKVGINPLSGCIPVVLQMPILFAMFSFFPNAIELRQESFLWAPDLSTYDSIFTWSEPFLLFGWNVLDNHISLFTILMTISTLVYTWFNNQMSTAVQGPMVAISYTMPLIFLFVLNSFPAGLSFYYFVSNVVTILQQIIIKSFVDEDSLRAKLDENRKNFQTGNGPKKSPFMQRLNDAMKAQEEIKKKGGKK